MTASSSPFELEIVATGRPRLVQSLRELWGYRGTILAFAERDIRVEVTAEERCGAEGSVVGTLLVSW